MKMSNVLSALFGSRTPAAAATTKAGAGSASAFLSLLKDRAQQIVQSMTGGTTSGSTANGTNTAKPVFGLAKPVKVANLTEMAVPKPSIKPPEEKSSGTAETKRTSDTESISRTVSIQPQPQAPAIFSPVMTPVSQKTDLPSRAGKSASASPSIPVITVPRGVVTSQSSPAVSGNNTQPAVRIAAVNPTPRRMDQVITPARNEAISAASYPSIAPERLVKTESVKPVAPQPVTPARAESKPVPLTSNANSRTAQVQQPLSTNGSKPTPMPSASRKPVTIVNRSENDHTPAPLLSGSVKTKPELTYPVADQTGRSCTVPAQPDTRPNVVTASSKDTPQSVARERVNTSTPLSRNNPAPVLNASTVQTPPNGNETEKLVMIDPLPRLSTKPVPQSATSVKPENNPVISAAPKSSAPVISNTINPELDKTATVAQSPAAVKTTESAQSAPRLNIFRQIQSYWQRYVGGTKLETVPPVARNSTPAIARPVVETIPDRRIAQIRESFRKWEKNVVSAAPRETTVKPVQAAVRENTPAVAQAPSSPVVSTAKPVTENPGKVVQAPEAIPRKERPVADLPKDHTRPAPAKPEEASAVRQPKNPSSIPVITVREALRAPVSNLDQPRDSKPVPNPSFKVDKTTSPVSPQTTTATDTAIPQRLGGNVIAPKTDNPVRATEKQTESVLKSIWGFRIGSRSKTVDAPTPETNSDTASTGKPQVAPSASVKENPVNPVLNRPTTPAASPVTAWSAPQTVATPANKANPVKAQSEQPAQTFIKVAAQPILATMVPNATPRSSTSRTETGSLQKSEPQIKAQARQSASVRETAHPQTDNRPTANLKPAEATREPVSSRMVDAAPAPVSARQAPILPVADTLQPKSNVTSQDSHPGMNRRDAVKSPSSEINRPSAVNTAAEFKPVASTTTKERPVESSTAANPGISAPRASEAPVVNPVIVPQPTDSVQRTSQTATKSSTHPVEPVRETAAQTSPSGSETNQAVQSTMVAENRETAQAAPTTAQFSRIKFSTEQIKELQALVSKVVQNARISVTGASEATFNWNVENMGALRFHITSNNDDVKIEISSTRQDVVEALEDGKGVMERMITDLGLRVEKFDVRIENGSRESDWMNQARQRGDNPQRQAEPDAGMLSSGTGSSESLPVEEPPVRRMPVNADHEWVA